MKKNCFTLLLAMLLTSLSFAQEKTVEDAYVDYFNLPRESLFLHTNKTTYFADEEIWFKVYAYDRKNNLSSKVTTNIYFGLYDEAGKQLDKKLFLSQNGAAVGNFAIDSTMASGTYYLKVNTNWMRNFKEDDAHIQQIQIINPNVPQEEITEISKKEYDFQFLPEGGHIVSNVKNNIGIKVIDDTGKGTKAQGIIVDSQNNEIATFRSNLLGIGKFSLTPKEGETYTAKVTLENGKTFDQAITDIRKNGVAISVNNIRKDRVIITLNTNESTLPQIQNKPYKLLIHKDGFAKSVPVTFDKTSKVISFPKDSLFKAVNTVTLFNDQNQPILERLFFNDASIKQYKLSVQKIATSFDSISYQIKSELPMQNDVLNTSVSVLPSETEAYNPDETIISNMYLKPYLKGTIENPRYYFTDINRKKLFELDALLLTQGWSRYSWDNIFHFPPKPAFDFENGVRINGHVNANIASTKSILMYPSTYNGSLFIDFDENGKFQMNNFYPQVGEVLAFSSYSNKGKVKKPALALNFLKLMNQDRVAPSLNKNLLSFYQDKNIIPEDFMSDDREQLDEIVIDAKAVEKSKRRKYRLPTRGKVNEITKEEIKRFNNLAEYLNFNGFRTEISPYGLYTITSLKIPQYPVIMFLDNQEINDASTLLDRPLSFYEDVFIDQNPFVNNFGIGRGDFGFRHVIKAFSRKGASSLYTIDRSKDYQQFITLDYGFEPVKEFYTPKYISYKINAFRKYGAIHWEPTVVIRDNAPFVLETIDTDLESIRFYVEGISSSGDLISQVIQVEK